MASHKPKISDLSSHLFWDCNVNEVTWEESKTLIISRVLQYGQLKDFLLLIKQYHLSELKGIVTDLKYLDPKTLNFISNYLSLPKEDFRCFTEKSLNQAHWIY